jgi:arylsulfatase A-like enzyme
LLSDHGQVTVSEPPLPLAQILLQLGVSDDDIEFMLSRHSVSFLYLTDPEKSSEIAAALEGYEAFDPILKQNVRPFIAIELAEMESGIDNVEGHLLEDGITGNERGELYSEWAVEFPAPDASKVRWPHIMVFNRHRNQTALVGTQKLTKAVAGPTTIGTHASISSVAVPLVMRGAGIASGVYDGEVTLADIVPTLYQLLGYAAPANVDGRVLGQILSR